jgi:hypothetical protein
MMSKGILQSILSRKLPLELVYRKPEAIDEDKNTRPAENEKAVLPTIPCLHDPIKEWHPHRVSLQQSKPTVLP